MDSFDTVNCSKCNKSIECETLFDDYSYQEWYNGKEIHSYNKDNEVITCECGNDIEFHFTVGVEAMTGNDTLEIEFSYGIKE